MFYIFKMKTKRELFYILENEKLVVFDLIFLWLLIFLMKQKRGNAVGYNIYFNCNACMFPELHFCGY